MLCLRSYTKVTYVTLLKPECLPPLLLRHVRTDSPQVTVLIQTPLVPVVQGLSRAQDGVPHLPVELVVRVVQIPHVIERDTPLGEVKVGLELVGLVLLTTHHEFLCDLNITVCVQVFLTITNVGEVFDGLPYALQRYFFLLLLGLVLKLVVLESLDV